MSVKRVSIHWVKAILAAAKTLGIETEQILNATQITLNLEKNQPSYLSLEQTQIIWQQAEKLSNHDHFGLIMGQAFRPSYFHVVAYLAMTSANLKQAYLHFLKFFPLISEAANLSLHYEGKQACIVFTPQIDQTPFSRHQYESALTLILTFTRWLIGNDTFSPTNVMFEHPQGTDLTLYQKTFSVIPKFNQAKTCIYIPAKALEHELVDSDTDLNRLHLEHANSLLARHLNRSWQEVTRMTIMQLGIPDISKQGVAQQLNISPRTLQRRLKEEDIHFQSLLDEMKKELSLKQITETDIPFKRIANELGFAEASTFYRAIKRWFNTTPQTLRQRGRHK